jgi:hypothetical protein
MTFSGHSSRFLADAFVPYEDVVRASRKLAATLVSQGDRSSLCADGPLAGVWNLERLTGDEAVVWGIWVTMRIRGRPLAEWTKV